MRLIANFKVPRVNLNRFRQVLHKQLSEALAQAAVAWLNATVTEIVPVYSTASRATFAPLASHVGYTLDLMPVAGAPNRISLGIANGTATWIADANAAKYSFSYATTLPHLIINEYYDATTFINPATQKPYFQLIHPGPYHFQEKGRKAFSDFASRIVLPGWGAFLDYTILRVS